MESITLSASFLPIWKGSYKAEKRNYRTDWKKDQKKLKDKFITGTFSKRAFLFQELNKKPPFPKRKGGY
jgi:hypothetical protein